MAFSGENHIICLQEKSHTCAKQWPLHHSSDARREPFIHGNMFSLLKVFSWWPHKNSQDSVAENVEGDDDSAKMCDFLNGRVSLIFSIHISNIKL